MLPGTESAAFPFWSEDSSYVGFFSDGLLKSVSVEGADVRNLAPAPDPRGGTWRGSVKDGVLVCYRPATSTVSISPPGRIGIYQRPCQLGRERHFLVSFREATSSFST